MNLDIHLKKSYHEAAQLLDKHDFFHSSLSNPFFTPPKISSFFDSALQIFAKGLVAQRSPSQFIVSPSHLNDILLYEVALELAKLSEPSYELKTTLPEESSIESAINSFCNSYKEAVRGVKDNKIMMFTASYFSSLSELYKPMLPSYSLKGDLFREKRMSFSDVIGLEEQKKIISRQLINPIKKSNLWRKLKKESIDESYVFLLYGPPGVGKTYFAQGIAGELGIPFFKTTGADFVQPLMGEGKNLLVKKYHEAASCSPSIIYIDEVDPLCHRRDSRNSELKQDLITEFLSILDGIKSFNSVITIMSSNMKSDYDPALLDRIPQSNRIYFGPVDERSKEKMLWYSLNKFNHSINCIPSLETFHPRSIHQLAHLAALYALERNAEKISDGDLQTALGGIVHANS